jgi:DnaJ-class molecular chaperone
MAKSPSSSGGDPNMNPGDQAPPGTPGTGENVCPKCKGTGRLDGERCEFCGGTGKIREGLGGG